MANLTKYIPDIFDLYIRIPFIEIHIGLLTKLDYCFQYNYLSFEIRIYKYSFNFKLRLSEKKLYFTDGYK